MKVLWQDQKMGELGKHGHTFLVRGDERLQVGRLTDRDNAIALAKFLSVPFEDEHVRFPREDFLPDDYYTNPKKYN